MSETPATPQLSADGQWWWDGGRWVPAAPPSSSPGLPPGRRRATGWSWARRIVSALVALVALATVTLFIVFATEARPVDPVIREGTLTKFIANCPVPGDVGDQCAFIDLDQFCYRIAPTDFQPALPDLTARVGQDIRFTVDRGNFDSSRLVGDPYCNFQVARVDLDVEGTNHRYQTAVMTESQFAGHSVGAILGSTVFPGAVLLLLLGWNLYCELRLRPRRA